MNLRDVGISSGYSPATNDPQREQRPQPQSLRTPSQEHVQLSREVVRAASKSKLDSGVLRVMQAVFGECSVPPRSIAGAVAERMTTLTNHWLGQAYPNMASLEALQIALSEMCPVSSRHSLRVAGLALRLARELGLNAEERRRLRRAAELKDAGLLAYQLGLIREDLPEALLYEAGVLHDIGKLALPAEILDSPRALTDEEFQVVQLHPVVGEALLLPYQELQPILPAVRGHHERWDGRGYPDALAGRQISVEARILAVVDSFDAMTGERPYRRPVSPRDAAAELMDKSGTQFDPDLGPWFAEMVLEDRLAG